MQVVVTVERRVWTEPARRMEGWEEERGGEWREAVEAVEEGVESRGGGGR